MKPCLKCAYKHLATAFVLRDEIPGNDDTEHHALLYGNLTCAEYHCVEVPLIAERIRTLRHMWPIVPDRASLITILEEIDANDYNHAEDI